ncbi:hypothetical protein BDR26DRAFT_855503 [Obelidium mucronatum]|nr:hypothetical protein BDR26DRAFT_855503 [Obelidium mucronatum]
MTHFRICRGLMLMSSFLSSVLLLSTSVAAFSNGTLLPGYLCGSVGDGMPKSLGGSAGLVIANYHNQNSITPQTDVAKTTSTMTKIAAGAAGTDPKAPLIGLLLFATDDNGQKIGTFSQMSTSMAPKPGIIWNAPSALFTKTITFGGLAVTETGFGFHSTTFQVDGTMQAPAVGNFMPNAPMPNRVLKCFPKGQVPKGLLGQMVTGGSIGVASNMTPPPMPPMGKST